MITPWFSPLKKNPSTSRRGKGCWNLERCVRTPGCFRLRSIHQGDVLRTFGWIGAPGWLGGVLGGLVWLLLENLQEWEEVKITHTNDDNNDDALVCQSFFFKVVVEVIGVRLDWMWGLLLQQFLTLQWHFWCQNWLLTLGQQLAVFRWSY